MPVERCILISVEQRRTILDNWIFEEVITNNTSYCILHNNIVLLVPFVIIVVYIKYIVSTIHPNKCLHADVKWFLSRSTSFPGKSNFPRGLLVLQVRSGKDWRGNVHDYYFALCMISFFVFNSIKCGHISTSLTI